MLGIFWRLFYLCIINPGENHLIRIQFAPVLVEMQFQLLPFWSLHADYRCRAAERR